MSARHSAHDHHDHGHGHSHDHAPAIHRSARSASPAALLRIGLGARLGLAGGLIALVWLLILLVLS
jgi:ABC-type nickel/cobalt efflux system permease component RcnA